MGVVIMSGECKAPTTALLVMNLLQSMIILALIVKAIYHDCKKARRRRNQSPPMIVKSGQQNEEEVNSSLDDIELGPIIPKPEIRLGAPTPKPLEEVLAELNINENGALKCVTNEPDKVDCTVCGRILTVGQISDIKRH